MVYTAKFFFPFLFKNFLFIMCIVGGGAGVFECQCPCVGSEDNLWESVFSFYLWVLQLIGLAWFSRLSHPPQQPTVQTLNPGNDGLTPENYKLK